MSDEALAAAQARAESAETQLAELQAQLLAQAVIAAPDAAGNSTQTFPHIDHYRVPKLPPFSQVDPALWFIQAEVSMRNSRIAAEHTKADTVLAALDVEVLGCVRDIITADPAPANIYEQIKTRIIATYAPSDEAKLRKLLRGQVGTDGKPSLILSRLRGLNDGNVENNVIKSIFLDQLPREHRAILVATGVTDLNRLAEAADRMADSALGTDLNASAVSKINMPPPEKTELQQLITSMTILSKKIEKLEKKWNSRSRSQSNSRRRRLSNSPNRGGTSSLCAAHTKYPNNPTSCREWCAMYETWKKQKN